MMFLEAEEAASAHAIEQYPRESCGIIVKDKYLPCKNTSDRDDRIRIDVAEHSEHWLNNAVQGVIHSHPDGPLYPTETDMTSQISTCLPWGIIGTDGKRCERSFWFGDTVPTPPLVGRGFRHGVTDCYTLIRDWYKEEHDLVLPVFPRSWGWWETHRSLYEEGFEEARFVNLGAISNPRRGDVFFAQIRAKKPNHAGVFLGKGKILHHLGSTNGYDMTHLSTIEPVQRYFPLITSWLRRIT